MTFSPDAHVPSPSTITVDTLRRLLEELPPGWQIVADGARRFLLLDEDDNGRGYLEVPEARINLLDELPE